MSSSKDPGQSGRQISLKEAVQLVTTFRNQVKSIVQPDYSSALPFSETFSKDIFEKLSSQAGAVGIRAYLGLDENKQVRLIFVATDDQNQDILPDQDGEDAAIFEYGQRCPPICGAGPLNPDA